MEQFFDWLKEPWPWYISGPIIGLMVPTLFIFGNKQFGISASLKDVCAVCVPIKTDFFKLDWKESGWRIVFVLGVLLGGYIGGQLLSNPNPIALSDTAITSFQKNGITNLNGLEPAQLFNWDTLLSIKGLILFVVGGFLVGFGTRYANGCTSGHAITGLSLLSPASLTAVIGFFIGGLFTSHLLLPIILKL